MDAGLHVAATTDMPWFLIDFISGGVTMVSGDITAAAADEIRALPVIATIVGGDVVHCADADVCG